MTRATLTLLLALLSLSTPTFADTGFTTCDVSFAAVTTPLDQTFTHGEYALADFNGDRRIDVALPTSETENPRNAWVAILTNDGSGAFRETTRLAVGPFPGGVVAGDLNRDRKLDLVVRYGYLDDAGISVLLGDGKGGFAPELRYPFLKYPTDVTLVDTNNDEVLDVVVSGLHENGVFILYGKADGTFAEHRFEPTHRGPVAVAETDLDRDGAADLLTVDFFAKVLSILVNRGDGTYLDVGGVSLSVDPNDLLVADLDDNGRLDAVVVDRYYDAVDIFLTRADGTFLNAVRYLTNGAREVEAADFTGDGILDIAISSGQNPHVSLLIGRGNGEFSLSTDFPLPLEHNYALNTADIDNDGDHDLTALTEHGFTVLRNENSTLRLTTTNLPTATVDRALNTRIRAAGGNGSHIFEIIAGELPDGVGFTHRGELYGAPRQTGTFRFTIRVTDTTTYCSRQRDYLLVVR